VMGIVFRRKVKLDDSTSATISNGMSISRRIGKCVTVNSRGRVSIRLLPELSFPVGGRRR
jgi:hypothetical protein